MSKDDAEDFLTEDPEISSQKVVLLSFLSPEKILANKDLFFFREFLQDYDLQWKSSKLETWMAGQLQQINDKLEKLAGSLDISGNTDAAKLVRSQELNVARFVEEFQDHKRKTLKEMKQTEIQQEFDDFVFKNGAKLEDEFFAKNEFRTTIRGIKVRGVFASEAEASARAKRLQKSDPNFNIYMGAVGKWMAWDPDPSRVSKQEYANEQLNTLMQKYRENEESRDEFYQTQKQRRVGTAKVKQSAEGEEQQVEDAETPFTGSSAAQAGTSYDGMFSGPADLAIQRKMQKKDE